MKTFVLMLKTSTHTLMVYVKVSKPKNCQLVCQLPHRT